MKLYIANVGVNTKDASKRGIKSPVFPDQTFEFIPIKECQEDSEFTYNIYRYSTLICYNNPEFTLSHYIAEKYSNYAVHNDPEFTTFTYGDIYTPRASNLKDVKQNDIILFLARLYEYKKGAGFTDNKGNFYFKGYYWEVLSFQKALKIDYKIAEYVFCGSLSYDKSNKIIIPFNKNKKEIKCATFHSKTRSIQSHLNTNDPTEKECWKKLLKEIKKHGL